MKKITLFSDGSALGDPSLSDYGVTGRDSRIKHERCDKLTPNEALNMKASLYSLK